MLPHSKKIILAILALFLLGLFWRFSTLLYFPASGSFLEKGDLAKLHPKETLQQNFTVENNDLAKVEIILRSPGIAPGDRAEAKLLDGNCQKTLRTGFLENSFLSSNNLYDFTFPIIPNSKNQTYCLALTFLSQKSTSHSLLFFSHPEAGSQFENTTTKEVFPDQTLSFRLVYKNSSFWKNLDELNQRISQYQPLLLKSIYLDLIAGGFLLLSLLLLIALLFL